MQLKTFVALLLPAMVVAESTTTCTSTITRTATVFLQRVATEYATLNTTTPLATGAQTPAPTPSKPIGAAGSLDARQYALAGVVGMVVVALM